ncbi:hypothetical protein JRQ81_019495 [Phrynocephalus forsythii]|uniref:DUF4219 domain-containing protein n=1 Tax=Phrynocephalus forsythii TaxID=171643 RepID=A0A9Q0XQA2_9SAUR|nr:hypothetical protein JRQ81_019495 [Phrynocephalus forsythii]
MEKKKAEVKTTSAGSSSMAEGSIPAFPVFQASMPNTPRLTSETYLSWAIKMEMYLKSQGLWPIVNEPPQVFSEEDLCRDQRALAIIIPSMDNSLLVH